jgi:hypothetical protein
MAVEPRPARTGALVFLVLLGCGRPSGDPSYSLVVGDDDGGGGFFAGADATASGSLQAHIERNAMTVKVITLSCSGPCADVEAVATGGNAPYSFAWDDGSTDPARTVCPTADTSYRVKVTDEATSGEFGRPSQTVQASVTADVIACPDGGAAADAGACDPDASEAPAINPSTVEVDPLGTTRYVAGGASLPAGRYRAQWIDGCMRWAYGGPAFGWDVNDPPPGVFGGPVSTDPGYCLLVTGSGTYVAALPGLTGSAADSGANDYASCVAATHATPAIDFDFAGGKLGVIANDLAAGDNTTGESAGGVSPTWRITVLSGCP